MPKRILLAWALNKVKRQLILYGNEAGGLDLVERDEQLVPVLRLGGAGLGELRRNRLDRGNALGIGMMQVGGLVAAPTAAWLVTSSSTRCPS